MTFFTGTMERIPRVKIAQEYFDLIFYYKTKQLIKKEHNKHSKIERLSCINFTSYKRHLYFNNVFVFSSYTDINIVKCDDFTTYLTSKSTEISCIQ